MEEDLSKLPEIRLLAGQELSVEWTTQQRTRGNPQEPRVPSCICQQPASWQEAGYPPCSLRPEAVPSAQPGFSPDPWKLEVMAVCSLQLPNIW